MLSAGAGDIVFENDAFRLVVGDDAVANGGGVKTVEVGDRRYVETSLSMDEVERAFLAATR